MKRWADFHFSQKKWKKRNQKHLTPTSIIEETKSHPSLMWFNICKIKENDNRSFIDARSFIGLKMAASKFGCTR